MNRKKSSDENKFALLLKGLVKDSSAQFDDSDLIDVEAEEEEALPPAKARMLPPGAAPKKSGRNKPIAPPEALASNSDTPLESKASIELAPTSPTELKSESASPPATQLKKRSPVTQPKVTAPKTDEPAAEEITTKPPQKPSIEKLKPRPWGKSRLEAKPVYDEDGNRKKGRPAKGKRSDGNWAGRTYYVRYTTDTKLEKALWKLRREGLDVDKSDLTDALLKAWAQIELGEVEDSGFGSLIERVIDRD